MTTLQVDVLCSNNLRRLTFFGWRMAEDGPRFYPNPYKDLSHGGKSDVINAQDGTILPEFRTRVEEAISSLLARLEASIERDGLDWSDTSVYTGVSGIALLYMHLSEKLRNPSLLAKSRPYLERSLPRLRGKRVTFLCGDSGPLTLAALMYHKMGDQQKSREAVNDVFKMARSTLDSDVPDELLYGRSGYLYSLALLRKQIGVDTLQVETELQSAVIDSGRSLADRHTPLMYEWHGKKYLGAAHGVTGILATLMQCDSQSPLIQPALDYLLKIRFSSGNLPSSIGSGSDRLIHWCHGAPGAVHCFLIAYRKYQKQEYMSAALQCGEVVWERGILTKGYGICHGVSGNVYTFLHLLQATKDPKYLHRACKFAEWCFGYGKQSIRTPDRPLSLFEGLAGAIYMLADLLDPQNAKFPSFIL